MKPLTIEHIELAAREARDGIATHHGVQVYWEDFIGEYTYYWHEHPISRSEAEIAMQIYRSGK